MEKQPATPPMQPLSLDQQPLDPHLSHQFPQLKSPLSSPLHSPSSFSAGSSGAPSPLLLAADELVPLYSRDEDSVLYSDSDAGSQTRTTRPSGSGSTTGTRKRTSSRPRRRLSEGSEKSNRSVRSSSGQREKAVPQTTKVFRNLLILEESLRQQCREQRELRRKFTAFLAVLAGLEGFVIYLLYFSSPPMSPVVQIVLKFSAFFIVVTLVLFQLSGEYRRTIVLPRRFFNSTNKGIRQLNVRLVRVKAPLGEQTVDFVRYSVRVLHSWSDSTFRFYGPLKSTALGQWIAHVLETLKLRSQPRIGPTDVKLVLNPRSFNSEIREQWELYRDEFWRRESVKQREPKKTKPVLNKESLMEKHRQERRDRRRSRVDN